MNKNVLLGLMGLATTVSIGVHLHRQDQPRYAPRKTAASGQIPQGQQEWLNLVRQNLATGVVDANDHERMAKAVARYAREQHKSADYLWQEMGPDNVGGRVRGICVVPTNHEKIWAGGVSGGLFRSMDGANTWQRMEAFSANLMVSSIAVLGNGQLYVATGCQWEGISGSGGSGFFGMGLFRSDDDGASFTQVLGPNVPWGGGDWTVINRILAHPTDPNKLLIASSNPGARIYNASDNSVTAMSTSSWANGIVTDVDVSSDGQTWLVTLGGGGDCYRSIDGGQNFEKFNGTSVGQDFPQSNLGRLEMAISPDDANHMFALGATGSGRMSGVWYSVDRGDHWFRMWPHNLSDTNPDAVPELDIFRDNHQGIYDNAIAVRPGHPDEVWIGGVEIWKTSITGQPEQLAGGPSFPGCFFCVHSDVHTIVFADATTAYVGCDGGVYKTPNGGENFYACNRDLAITQFYSVAYNTAGNVGAGAQDNGTQFIDGYGNTPNEARSIGGGDGFDIDFSQMDTNIFFTSVYNGDISRSNDHGSNSGDFYDDNVPVNPNASLGVGLGDFYTNFRLFENPRDGNSPYQVKKVFSIGAGDYILPGQTRAVPFVGTLGSVTQYGEYTNPSATDTIFGPWSSDTLYLTDRLTSMFAIGFSGSQGVWGTREALNFNTTPQWAKLVANVSGNTTCMEWSSNGDMLFYGTDAGEVFRVTGFNQAYTLNALSVDSPGYVLHSTQIYSGAAPVTGLAPDPTYDAILVATFGGYGGSGKVKRTVNALAPTVANSDWTNIWNVPGELTGMPCYDACVHKDNGNIIAVGTEFGIWVTDDAGNTWTMQNNGINGVPVFAMRQQTWNWQNNPVGPDWVKNPNVIYAGTHGRGIFRTEALVGIRPIAGGATNTVNDLLMVPNPANTLSTVSFTLARQGDVTVNVYDLNGALVRSITRKNLAAARQNVPIDVQAFASGTYLVEVRTADGRTSGRMVVSR